MADFVTEDCQEEDLICTGETVKESSRETTLPSDCRSCQILKKEISDLKSGKQLPVPLPTVPEEVWDILPPNANYIKNILKFCGYETADSIIRLSQDGELDKVFSFMNSMSDLVEDKEAVFGIFHRNPERLVVLPGLQVVVDKFISEVAKYNEKVKRKAPPTDLRKKTKKIKTHVTTTPSLESSSVPVMDKGNVDIEKLETRLIKWFHKQTAETKKKYGIADIDNLALKSLFSFKKQSDEIQFTCGKCKKTLIIPCKGGTVSLSNVQRHFLSEKLCKKQKTQERINFPTASTSTSSATQESTNDTIDIEGCKCYRYNKKPVDARWSSRSFRRQRALQNAAECPGQLKITDFFDVEPVVSFIEQNTQAQEEITQLCGSACSTGTIKPILLKLMENAKSNAGKTTGSRHDAIIVKFASALYCLIGKASYELLQVNLGTALPSVATLQRSIGRVEKIKEGDFRFDELARHLKNWNAPNAVHIHLDDTRILNRVEYDEVTDRFVGFCLPVNKDGLPQGDAFVMQSFEEIKDAINTKSTSSYAHCIVAKPLTTVAPPFVLFAMGTDSKYCYDVIMQRWEHIEKNLSKRNILVISNGSDGAGPFLKAMLQKTKLFSISNVSNVPPEWQFYIMPNLYKRSLCSQDMVHLLAKLRTRLITPSNLLFIGSETACRGHLTELLKEFPKAQHGLTHRAIDSRDKQNYSSIELLVKPSVEICLGNLNASLKTKGTVIYLNMMRDMRDAFFDKSLGPLCRLFKMWKSVFFLRIWRRWLKKNECKEDTYFVSNNAYLCAELNAHMLLNLMYNVVFGFFPPEALRVWCSGSQACEQLFRLLRSMTPTFSTVVNFTMKGTLNRIHKLQFLATAECDDRILFPRVQRRILQIKDESKDTLAIPALEEITGTIYDAKTKAVDLAKSCNIDLESFDDKELLISIQEAVDHAVANDGETDENAPEDTIVTEDAISSSLSTANSEKENMTTHEIVTIREDLSQIRLRKTSDKSNIFPSYGESDSPGSSKSKSYRISKPQGKGKEKSPFVLYDGTYIRKTTALYILQENSQLSGDRLLRVRAVQPDHVYVGSQQDVSSSRKSISSGDLCIFKRVDCSECLVGRVVQFSYLSGTKKQRQFSNGSVDLEKASASNIGVYANWFYGVKPSESQDETQGQRVLAFRPVELQFTCGYLTVENYVATIHPSVAMDSVNYSFSIAISALEQILPNWRKKISFQL